MDFIIFINLPHNMKLRPKVIPVYLCNCTSVFFVSSLRTVNDFKLIHITSHSCVRTKKIKENIYLLTQFVHFAFIYYFKIKYNFSKYNNYVILNSINFFIHYLIRY